VAAPCAFQQGVQSAGCRPGNRPAGRVPG
jgi:hypothetical protein